MITVLFGTESGNSEMAADDVAEFIRNAGGDAKVIPMEDFDIAMLPRLGLAIVITSTYGEGELPETTQPFYNALAAQKPDLSALKFGAFGLGDSTYETYGNGIDMVSSLLRALGAVQLGEAGRHDAAKGQALNQMVVDWVRDLLPQFFAQIV